MTPPSQESYIEEPYLACYNGKLIHPRYGYGLCQCGCGATTRILYGRPQKRIHGHQNRLQGPDYEPRDCGYKTPCWGWLKLLDQHGYGRVTVLRKNRRATHAYYRHFKGADIPDDMHLDHLCRNRACVNPDHLEAVPPASNVRRGAKAIYTEDDIRAMVQMRRDGILYKDISRRFGIKMEYVQAICRGERWKGIIAPEDLPQRGSRMTNDQLDHVIELRLAGLKAKQIGPMVGLSEQTTYHILQRRNLGKKMVPNPIQLPPRFR